MIDIARIVEDALTAASSARERDKAELMAELERLQTQRDALDARISELIDKRNEATADLDAISLALTKGLSVVVP